MADGPLTPAVFHVLLALANGPLHGYAIMRAVDDTAGQSIPTGPGSIYGTLQRLETAGLVKESPANSEAGRRLFVLTATGRKALEAEAVRLRRLAKLVGEYGLGRP
jgi:DNA-binding PadR family transcriptional regulator